MERIKYILLGVITGIVIYFINGWASCHRAGENSKSIGICYVGGLAKDCSTPKDTRTEAQKQSLLELLKELKERYPNATMHGHREFADKACPCFDAKSEYKDL